MQTCSSGLALPRSQLSHCYPKRSCCPLGLCLKLLDFSLFTISLSILLKMPCGWGVGELWGCHSNMGSASTFWHKGRVRWMKGEQRIHLVNLSRALAAIQKIDSLHFISSFQLLKIDFFFHTFLYISAFLKTFCLILFFCFVLFFESISVCSAPSEVICIYWCGFFWRVILFAIFKPWNVNDGLLSVILPHCC